jgi:hypothetical protein
MSLVRLVLNREDWRGLLLIAEINEALNLWETPEDEECIHSIMEELKRLENLHLISVMIDLDSTIEVHITRYGRKALDLRALPSTN